MAAPLTESCYTGPRFFICCWIIARGLIVISFAVFHGVLYEVHQPVDITDKDERGGGVGEAEVVNALRLGRG
jgi:hypothetical protein